MSVSSRRKALTFTLLAVTLGGGVALLATELVLRAFQLAPSRGVLTVTQGEFERVPGLFRPNQQIVDRRLPALPFRVSIDSLGYRGPDVSRRKVEGELRIVAAGDSFTFGDFVDDEQTLPAQLQAILARKCARPVTVVNAGVGGSTIVTHAEMVERAWALSPDVVLLTFSENDVTDLRDPLWFGLARNREAKSRFPLSVVYPMLNRLALWHLALEVRARARSRAVDRASVGRSRKAAGTRTGDPSPLTDSLRAIYRDRLHALHADVLAHGARLVLAAYPSHNTVSERLSDEQLRWVEQMGRDLGVPTVNLLPVIRAGSTGGQAMYLLPHDGHPSPAGYATATSALAERLLDAGVCSWSSAAHPADVRAAEERSRRN